MLYKQLYDYNKPEAIICSQPPVRLLLICLPLVEYPPPIHGSTYSPMSQQQLHHSLYH